MESSNEENVQKQLRTKIKQLLKSSDVLTYREREIIILRFGLQDGYSYTLEEIATIFRLSREGVRLIVIKALRKLRMPPGAANAKKPQRRKRRFGDKK